MIKYDEHGKDDGLSSSTLKFSRQKHNLFCWDPRTLLDDPFKENTVYLKFRIDQSTSDLPRRLMIFVTVQEICLLKLNSSFVIGVHILLFIPICTFFMHECFKYEFTCGVHWVSALLVFSSAQRHGSLYGSE